jgi:Zn-dependent protease with chaperone function
VIYAYSNPRRIRITRGMVNFAADDSELAFVVAHELAHILLNDFEKYRIGDRRPLDLAADQTGMRLAARAGYDPDKGARLLLRLADAFSEIRNDPTYPSPQERYARLEQQIAEMRAR